MKILGYVFSVIFVIVSIFLWFRGADGSGLTNTLSVKIASLSIWGIFCLIVLAIYLITYYFMRHRS